LKRDNLIFGGHVALYANNITLDVGYVAGDGGKFDVGYVAGDGGKSRISGRKIVRRIRSGRQNRQPYPAGRSRS
jgi:hypothetical protein